MAEPVANDDLYTAVAGESAQLGEVFKLFGFLVLSDTGLLSNDSDSDGDALQIVSVEGQTLSNGTVTVEGSEGGLFTISADGTISFDGTTGFEDLSSGETRDTIVTYTVTDGETTTTATVTVRVSGVDGDGLAVVNDSTQTDQNTTTSLNVLDNDDQPLDAATVTAVNGAPTDVGTPIQGSNGGVFTVNSDGSLSFDPNGEFDYLADGETVETTVTYTASASGSDADGVVSITVTGVNDAPTSADDIYTATAGELGVVGEVFVSPLFTIDVNGILANDSDVDGDAISIVNVGGEVADENGIFTVSGGNSGTFIVEPNGQISFDATSGFEALSSSESQSTSIQYTISDGELESTSTITVVVSGVDGDTVTAQADSFTVDEDSVGNFNVLDNDDQPLEAATVTAVDGLAGNVDIIINGSNGGTFVISSDGSMTFDPNGDFEGLVDGETAETSISYTADVQGEESTAIATVVVTGVNDAVVVEDDFYTVDAGSVSQLADLSVFTLVIDGSSFDLSTVDDTVDIDDSDVDSDSLIVTAVDGQPLTGGSIVVAGQNGGLFTVSRNGSVSFDATTDFDNVLIGNTETTQITYTVADSQGLETTGNIIVTVNGQLNPFVANSDFLTTDQNTSVQGYNVISDNDVSLLSSSSLSAVNNDFSNIDSPVQGSNGGTFVIDASGTLSFDPGSDFVDLADGETAVTSISYTIENEGGDTSSATVFVTVSGLNDDFTLEVVGEDFTVNAGETKTLAQVLLLELAGTTVEVDQTLFVNDNDSDGDALTLVSVNGQEFTGGSVTVAGTNGGLFTIDALGNLDFDASTGFESITESVTTSFTYTLGDGKGSTETATVNVEVQANNVVQAGDDAFEIVENPADEPIVLDVLANDEDLDETDSVTIVSVDDTGLEGAITFNDNEVLYTTEGAFEELAEGEEATTSFTYTALSSDGTESTATATITVTGENDAPETVDDDFGVINSNETYTFASTDLLEDDTDIDNGAVLSVVSIGQSGAGVLTDNGDGSFTYNPNGELDYLTVYDDPLVQEFVYTVEDELGAQTNGIVTISVQGIAEPAFAEDDSRATEENAAQPVVLEVLSNDEDRTEGESVSLLSIDTTNLQGSAAIVGDTVSYDPNGAFEALAEGETATTSFDYTIESDDGTQDTATVTVTVTGENDAPDSVNDSLGRVDANGSITFALAGLLANDTDVDNNASLSIGTLSSGGNLGLITDNGDGTATWSTNGDFDHLNEGLSQPTGFFYTTVDEFGAESVGAYVSIQVDGIKWLDAQDDTLYLGTNLEEPFYTQDGRFYTQEHDLLDNNFASDILTSNDQSLNGPSYISHIDIRGSGVSAFDFVAPGGHLYLGDATQLNAFAFNSPETSFTYTLADYNGNASTASVTVEHQGAIVINPDLLFDSVRVDQFITRDVGASGGVNATYILDTSAILPSYLSSDLSYDETHFSEIRDVTTGGVSITNLGNGLIEIEKSFVNSDPIFGPSPTDSQTVLASLDLRYLDGDGNEYYADFDVWFDKQWEPWGIQSQNLLGTGQDIVYDRTFNVTSDFTGTLWDIIPDGNGPIYVQQRSSIGEYSNRESLDYSFAITNLGEAYFTRPTNGIEVGQTETITRSFMVIDENTGNWDEATITVNVTGVQEGISTVGPANNINLGSFTSVLEGTYLSEDTLFSFDDGYLLEDKYDLNFGFDSVGENLSVTRIDSISSNGAQIILNADGSYTYDPTVAFDPSGSNQVIADQFGYEVTSSDGSVATFVSTIRIVGADDDPVV